MSLRKVHNILTDNFAEDERKIIRYSACQDNRLK